jgi:L-threonylcarbamoyladenylate synthase
MNTKVIQADKRDVGEIREAAEALREGGLVAFPTETVYGLGANALDPEAVAKIFKAKGRPQDNPLIVHIADKNDLKRLVKKIPEKATALTDAFWPGPLTLILKKSDIIPEVITGGLDTVAIRMPDNDIALALIKDSKVPIAAPSANLSGRPSPTSAKHVADDLSGRIAYIVDGGRTRIGVESTVLDLTVEPPTLLRPGGITTKEIEDVVGKIAVRPAKRGAVRSPGMKYRHYSPKARVVLAKKGEIQNLADKYMGESLKVGIMATDNGKYGADIVRSVGEDYDEIANNLFETFREFDRDNVDIIIAQGVKEEGLGLAIMNRLKKASSPA